MNDTITRDEARDRIGRAIYADDWIGSLRIDEVKLLSGPFGIRKKTLSNGRPIDFIDVCPADSRTQLDIALGRQLRSWAQLSSTVDWMEEHGISVTETLVPRKVVEKCVLWIRDNMRRDDPPHQTGGRPSTVDWDAAEQALSIEIRERGFPTRDNTRGWRTQADIERWMHAFLSDRNEPAGDTTVRDHVREMLGRIPGPK
jgi:hypothetical protein